MTEYYPPRSLVGLRTILVMLLCAIDTPPGAYVEVGVYKGGTAWWLARLAEDQRRYLYLYDTFEGQPHAVEGLDKHPVGDFGDTDYDAVRNAIPYADVVKGVFPGSAVEMGKIAFVHLDCDQYQSVKEAVLYLWPRMVAGGVIWFDDSPDLAGAKQAVEELFPADRIQTSVVGKHFVRKDQVDVEAERAARAAEAVSA